MPSRHQNISMDLRQLKGIGPKRADALRELDIHSVEQLLHYYPRAYLDRSCITKIKDLPKHFAAGKEVTVIASVFRTEVRRTKKRTKIFFLTIKDETGFVTCVFYAGVEWYANAFEQGEVLAVSAVPELDRLNRIQFIHPEFDRLSHGEDDDETDWSKLLHTGSIIPKYSSSEELRLVGLDNRGFRRLLKQAVTAVSTAVCEHLPAAVIQKYHLPGIHAALRQIHFPKSYAERDGALRRLKFDELFFFELLMAYRRREVKSGWKGISFSPKSELARLLVQTLPFELTAAQKRVIGEITADMQASSPMNRLLQGDVGSGKTIVALFAMLVAVANGYQSALMAPTEILAEQHYRSLEKLLASSPLTLRLLIGGQKKRLRDDVLEDVRGGQANIVIGTHALLEERVLFNKLGLVVVDEQHRFGVAQRSRLREKGNEKHPDVLVMTATPIPRTLSLTLYGDLDVSVIDELPKDRKSIRTAVRGDEDKGKVYAFLREEIGRGRQAYVVYPLIEESEKLDLKAAEGEYVRLQNQIFPELKVGLLHGRLPSDEKDAVMRRFSQKEIDILVATTVIEVGIDVPNATVMVIENAERFGLSQLHQLRGRVGRGGDQSYCILLTNKRLQQKKTILAADRAQAQEEIVTSQQRLQTMVQTSDGFAIAEADLRLRGPGEYFGTRQSGLPEFRIADLVLDAEIVSIARDSAFGIVETDPHLRLPEHAEVHRRFEVIYKHLLSLVRTG
ncbi:MAG: ATP-dependent DNA helicase RecG [Ignavibacteriales bacterium]|nr:ATP-dependent DNA helicase RecG [Ignavibacteriales bacterium]